MSAERKGAKRRWLASAAGAAVILAALVALFRAPSVSLPNNGRAPERPPIKLSPGRGDELAMRDLAPLFLPTEYNAVPTPLPELEPGRNYFERDPGTRWKFEASKAALQLPVPVQAPASPIDVVAETLPPLAAGIGRTDATVPPMQPNGGHVDVFAGDAHESVLQVTLPPDTSGPIALRGPVAWKPLEFVAAVDAAGLTGPLVLTRGSGVEEIDNHFRNFLAGAFRLGDRLPPGFYRIVVGP